MHEISFCSFFIIIGSSRKDHRKNGGERKQLGGTTGLRTRRRESFRGARGAGPGGPSVSKGWPPLMYTLADDRGFHLAVAVNRNVSTRPNP